MSETDTNNNGRNNNHGDESLPCVTSDANTDTGPNSSTSSTEQQEQKVRIVTSPMDAANTAVPVERTMTMQEAVSSSSSSTTTTQENDSTDGIIRNNNINVPSVPQPSMLNDESNPQQGTQQQQRQQQQNGISVTLNNDFDSSNSHSRPSSATAVTPTSNTSFQTATASTTTAVTASSSPKTPSHTIKIPPTIKDERKIFVGGLPSDVTPEEFRQCFEQFGTVIDSVIIYDRITTRSRGFGFVRFENPEVCQWLIQIQRLPMRPNKFVEIKEAQPRDPAITPTSPTYSSTYGPVVDSGGDIGGMIPNAPVPVLYPVLQQHGEIQLLDPSSYSYMGGTQYGQPISDIPVSSLQPMAGPVDFSPYYGIPTNVASSAFYPSTAPFDCHATTSYIPDMAPFVANGVLPSNNNNNIAYGPYYGIPNGPSYADNTTTSAIPAELSPRSPTMPYELHSMPSYCNVPYGPSPYVPQELTTNNPMYPIGTNGLQVAAPPATLLNPYDASPTTRMIHSTPQPVPPLSPMYLTAPFYTPPIPMPPFATTNVPHHHIVGGVTSTTTTNHLPEVSPSSLSLSVGDTTMDTPATTSISHDNFIVDGSDSNATTGTTSTTATTSLTVDNSNNKMETMKSSTE